MGCHTWYYTKIERTQEEATDVCLSVLRKQRNDWWKSFRNWKEWTEWYGLHYERVEYSSEHEFKKYCLKWINILNRQIRMVSNGYCKRAVWNHQSGLTGSSTEYIDGAGLFIEIDYFHDGFRVGYDDDTRLFSRSETLDYISMKLQADQIRVNENTLEIINEFWSKYPNGMIRFG